MTVGTLLCCADARCHSGARVRGCVQALSPLMDLAASEYGAFNPACYIHTSFGTSGPIINGSSYLDALTAWYTKSGSPSSYKLRDNCGIECNPTCP